MSDLLHAPLERAADDNPDSIAVGAGSESMTYAALDARANQIARLLVRMGIGRGHRVGLLLDKSLEAVAGLYGIMKSGAAYVPLDPGAPAARIASIVIDCDLQTLISSPSKTATWQQVLDLGGPVSIVITPGATDVAGVAMPGGVSVIDATAVDAEAIVRPSVEVAEADLALILYTSGSTGKPKGVMLSHRNVMSFVAWAAEEFSLTQADRLSQLAPLHFDLSTLDLFSTAIAGASVHLVSRQTSMFPMQIRRFLESERISVMYTVPSILTAMTERAGLELGDLPDLRTILFAGEVFPAKYLSRLMHLFPSTEFANLFGPTETNACTFYRVPEPPAEDGPPISIGRAIAGVATSVVTEDGDLVERGDVGELLVRGPTVMQGYWAAGGSSPDPEAGLYRTGDLVRETESGDFDFIGRKDSQIKSRGYRIELGDIEAAMLAHPDMIECAAIAVPDDHVTNRITACIVTRNGLTEEEIVQFVSDRIPKYMIPETFEFRDQLPKTSTGKIDRQILRSATTERRSE